MQPIPCQIARLPYEELKRLSKEVFAEIQRRRELQRAGNAVQNAVPPVDAGQEPRTGPLSSALRRKAGNLSGAKHPRRAA
ncbi:MAG: hypothetical protein ABR915_16095 [Thermoguttaceae bacterium]|jgi:hypothetical protein